MNNTNIITHIRNNCILCNGESNLIDIQTLKMPLYSIFPKNINKDINWKMKYGYCEKCYSVQLKTLLDPNILYDKNYIQPVSVSYNWIQHNISFIKFIVDCIEPNNALIEVGSSSFILGKHLIQYYKDYTVFDYSLEQAIKQDNVKYIEGNCENYNFEPKSNIIMSHVFEHLYEPKKFVTNCKNNKIQNIIISIPNMENPNVLHVFNLHTFLYSINDIQYIFGLNNYKLVNNINFNTRDNSFPCLFLHFELTNEVIQVDRVVNLNRSNYIKKMLQPIIIPKHTFLATAGFMMTSIYSLIENKENIIGIIDGNKLIQGSLFADTTHIIQPYEYLKCYDKNTNIFIFQYRKDDIINCIRKVNNEINIVVI
jgi:hypothetical protein